MGWVRAGEAEQRARDNSPGGQEMSTAQGLLRELDGAASMGWVDSGIHAWGVGVEIIRWGEGLRSTEEWGRWETQRAVV